MRNLLCVSAICLMAAPAVADPKFEYGKIDEVKKVKDVEWTAAAEGGIVFTTGNSETTTLVGGFKASRKTGKNKFAAEGSLTYARSGIRVLDDMNANGVIDSEDEITTVSTTTAETLAAKLRYDRFLTETDSLYIAALAARDVPAGKDSVFGGQVGYSRQLYKSKTAELLGELGIDYSREDLVTGEPINIISARAFVGYKATMTEGTTLDAALEALTNFNHETLATRAEGADFGEDTRVNAKVAVSSKIGKNLSFQTSIEVKYDHRPGPLAIKNLAMGFVPEASPMDTIMKATLIYSFFEK
jgi:hypothetical protein